MPGLLPTTIDCHCGRNDRKWVSQCIGKKLYKKKSKDEGNIYVNARRATSVWIQEISPDARLQNGVESVKKKIVVGLQLLDLGYS